MPLVNGGRSVGVYVTGEPFLQQRADEDPEELQGVIEGLGVRSGILTPLNVGQQRRGVVQAVSAAPEHFGERDLQFLTAVSGWVGMLTRRQQEVAGCIAEGLTNEEIARRLVLASGTVANHVEAILRRLDLRSRTQIGVWAVERGLFRSASEDER